MPGFVLVRCHRSVPGLVLVWGQRSVLVRQQQLVLVLGLAGERPPVVAGEAAAVCGVGAAVGAGEAAAVGSGAWP